MSTNRQLSQRLEFENEQSGTASLVAREGSALDPYPEGWYALAVSDELAKGQLQERRWIGKSIVIWRDLNGDVCVADATCPHLGSHLGPSAGGIVRDGNLVCPFHGFEYDIRGQCVATPASEPPQMAKLTCYESLETNGLIFAYYGRTSNQARWQMPVFPTDTTDRAVCKMRFRAHPQITSENSVDRGHLNFVHGYSRVEKTKEVEVDGPFLHAYYSFTRNMLTQGLRRFKLSVDISITVWGLGVSTVDVFGPSGLKVRQWILSTPVDGELIDMWLVVDLRSLPGWWWLKSVLKTLARKITPRILINDLRLEVTKDEVIWAKQHYRARPVLGTVDRDIAIFRRYCRQFYS